MKSAPPRCPRVGSFVALGVLLAAGFAADAAGAAARQFGVTEEGAVADGKTPNPVAIRMASDRVGASGRGIRAIPAGPFPGGSIFFETRRRTRVGGGRGAARFDEHRGLPEARGADPGHFAPWRMALVNAQGLTWGRSGGEGSINGNGVPEWPAFRDRRADNLKCPHREVERPPLRFIDRCRPGRVEALALPDAGWGNLPICPWRDARIDGRRITLTAGGAAVPGRAVDAIFRREGRPAPARAVTDVTLRTVRGELRAIGTVRGNPGARLSPTPLTKSERTLGDEKFARGPTENIMVKNVSVNGNPFVLLLPLAAPAPPSH